MAALSEEQFVALYDHLRAMARRYRWEQDSLQPTAVVHEAFLRLQGAEWPDPIAFKAVAARAMRQVLIDHARRRNAERRGGGWEKTTLAGLGQGDEGVDALALEEALQRLEALDACKAQVVQLRFFGGLTHEEIAAFIGVSLRTVEKDWRSARAWLLLHLQ